MSEHQDWRAIDKQARADLDTIETDQDAYEFIRTYFVKDLQGRYMELYRSSRQEMLKNPRQAIDNLLSLPPLE